MGSKTQIAAFSQGQGKALAFTSLSSHRGVRGLTHPPDGAAWRLDSNEGQPKTSSALRIFLR